jgi:hypothetical protein
VNIIKKWKSDVSKVEKKEAPPKKIQIDKEALKLNLEFIFKKKGTQYE